MMESTDREILLEIVREQKEQGIRIRRVEERIAVLEEGQARIRGDITAMDRRLAIVETRLDDLTRMQDMTLWAIGLAFAALAVIVAFVGVYAPKFWGNAPARDESGRVTVDDVVRLAGLLRGDKDS